MQVTLATAPKTICPYLYSSLVSGTLSSEHVVVWPVVEVVAMVVMIGDGGGVGGAHHFQNVSAFSRCAQSLHADALL